MLAAFFPILSPQFISLLFWRSKFRVTVKVTQKVTVNPKVIAHPRGLTSLRSVLLIEVYTCSLPQAAGNRGV